MDRKAFAVTEESEGHGEIIFAKTAVEARRRGADQLDSEFGSVSCRRAQWADEFAESRIVPARVMIENGWWLECTGCQRRLTEDGMTWPDEDEEGNELPLIDPVGTQHYAFCCAACKSAFEAERARIKRAEKRAFKVLCREILRRYPGVEICPANDDKSHTHHTYVNHHSKSMRWRVIQVCVGFRFPGCKTGDAHFRYELGYDATKGERSLLVCNGDKAAWEAFRERRAALSDAQGEQ